jgi:hypothetical protein
VGAKRHGGATGRRGRPSARARARGGRARRAQPVERAGARLRSSAAGARMPGPGPGPGPGPAPAPAPRAGVPGLVGCALLALGASLCARRAWWFVHGGEAEAGWWGGGGGAGAVSAALSGAAARLELDLGAEPGLRWVAEAYLAAPLPAGWSAAAVFRDPGGRAAGDPNAAEFARQLQEARSAAAASAKAREPERVFVALVDGGAVAAVWFFQGLGFAWRAAREAGVAGAEGVAAAMRARGARGEARAGGLWLVALGLVLARFAPEAELRCAVAAAAAAALVLGAPGVQQWEPEAEAVEAWLVE